MVIPLVILISHIKQDNTCKVSELQLTFKNGVLTIFQTKLGIDMIFNFWDIPSDVLENSYYEYIIKYELSTNSVPGARMDPWDTVIGKTQSRFTSLPKRTTQVISEQEKQITCYTHVSQS